LFSLIGCTLLTKIDVSRNQVNSFHMCLQTQF
jgi:hypothetical protein